MPLYLDFCMGFEDQIQVCLHLTNWAIFQGPSSLLLRREPAQSNSHWPCQSNGDLPRGSAWTHIYLWGLPQTEKCVSSQLPRPQMEVGQGWAPSAVSCGNLCSRIASQLLAILYTLECAHVTCILYPLLGSLWMSVPVSKHPHFKGTGCFFRWPMSSDGSQLFVTLIWGDQHPLLISEDTKLTCRTFLNIFTKQHTHKIVKI